LDVINAKTVKTRKEHKCWGCSFEFPKGSRLERVTVASEGSVNTAYWCDVCSGFYKVIDPLDGIVFGEFLTEYRDEWEEYRRLNS